MKQKFKNISLYLAFFLFFSGYYVLLMIWSNNDLSGPTRSLTIPIRILILFTLAVVYILNRKSRVTKVLILFLIFSVMYYFRIIIEFSSGNYGFHISILEFFLYYTAFVFLPFLIISQTNIDQGDTKLIFHSLLLSTLILSVFTLLYYHSIIGVAGRISSVITKDENYTSPLALSYCGSLGLGTGIIYLITNRSVETKEKALIFLVIITSLVPFYLGASRGSIIALFLPFIVLVLSTNSKIRRIKIITLLICIFLIVLIFAIQFGSSVFERFFNIQDDIVNMRSSAKRVLIWQSTFEQFLENPLFGNGLESFKYKSHPHNIFLEVLISTGLLGFIPFTILIIKTIKAQWEIFTKFPENAWLPSLFLQCIVQNFFSGGLYSASWLFASIILVNIKIEDFSYDTNLH